MSNNLRWLLLVVLVSTWTLAVLNSLDHKEELDKAYAKGYQAGAASVDLKKILKEDKKLANKACYVWWFGMDHKQRKLEKS